MGESGERSVNVDAKSSSARNIRTWSSISELKEAWTKSGRTDENYKWILDTLARFDSDNNGKFELSEVVHMCEELCAKKQENNFLAEKNTFLRRALVALAVLFCVALLSIFGVVNLALVMHKQYYVGDHAPVLLSLNDEPVRTSMTDVDVSNGVLVPRNFHDDCPASVNCSRRLQEESPNPIAVRQAPLKRSRLSSTVPNEFLAEMKNMVLQNSVGDTVTLTVMGFSRKYQDSAKCGTVLIVNCARGYLTMDDFDIYLSAELKNKLFEEGFQWNEKPGSTALGRRLSEGHTIEGMFMFFREYEWKCESFSRPLSKFEPPYSYQIETRIPCTSTCESELFPGSHLPGFTLDGRKKTLTKFETVFAFDNEVISFIEYPSHPFMIMQSTTDVTTGETKTQIETNGVVHSCSIGIMSKEQQLMSRYENFRISPMGTFEEGNRSFRRYEISAKNASDEERIKSTLEFWEDAFTDQPYKVYMPMNPLVSTTYFAHFTKSVDAETMSSIKSRFKQECLEPFGPNMTKDGFAKENEDTVKYIRDQLRASPVLMDRVRDEDRKYWEMVRRLFFEGDPVDKANSSSASQRRHWARDSVYTLYSHMVEHSRGSSAYFLPARTDNKSVELQNVRNYTLAVPSVGAENPEMDDFDLRCAINFKLGDVLEMKFCYNGMPVSVENGEVGVGEQYGIEAEMSGEFKTEFTPPFYVSLAFSGNLKLDLLPLPVTSSGRLSIKLAAGLNLVVAKCTVYLEGSAEASSGPIDKWGYLTGQIVHGIEMGASCEMFGITLGPYINGLVKFAWANLGGYTTDDDTMEISGILTIGFNFWIFKVEWMWFATFMQKTHIESGEVIDPSDVPGAWTRDCACGDFLKCGSIQYCDDWLLNAAQTSVYDTGDQYCNRGQYLGMTFDWEGKVDCGPGQKRCYCQRLGADLEPGEPQPRWSDAFEDNQCANLLSRAYYKSGLSDCIRHYCFYYGLEWAGNTLDVGKWYFIGLCNTLVDGYQPQWSYGYEDWMCADQRKKEKYQGIYRECIEKECEGLGLKFDGKTKDMGHWFFRGWCAKP